MLEKTLQLKKHHNLPRVSIGIPTYNRAKFLKRSIESALNQNYKNIEVIISDNASTDETHDICHSYCEKFDRIKYIKQSANIGATSNFSEVLKNATGEFFMWLGDDDWIDNSYIQQCMYPLLLDSSISLVSGVPQYYNGLHAFEGKKFNLLQQTWWCRVIGYYAKVSDNGMFYGVVRTEQIRKVKMHNTMGGDWHLIAGLSSLGKIMVIPEVSVHRELGGATSSYFQIADALGLPRIQGFFPMTSIAISAWIEIAIRGSTYQSRSNIARTVLATLVFIVILSRRLWRHCISVTKKMFC